MEVNSKKSSCDSGIMRKLMDATIDTVNKFDAVIDEMDSPVVSDKITDTVVYKRIRGKDNELSITERINSSTSPNRFERGYTRYTTGMECFSIATDPSDTATICITPFAKVVLNHEEHNIAQAVFIHTKVGSVTALVEE
jgi:hypothetical protein